MKKNSNFPSTLEEAGYRVLPVCELCTRYSSHIDSPQLAFGSCSAFERTVAAMGQCVRFELDDSSPDALGEHEEFYCDAELLLRQIFRRPRGKPALDRVATAHESIGLLAKKACANLTDRERESLDERFRPDTELATHSLADIEKDHATAKLVRAVRTLLALRTDGPMPEIDGSRTRAATEAVEIALEEVDR
jgi:hypothetical protein